MGSAVLGMRSFLLQRQCCDASIRLEHALQIFKKGSGDVRRRLVT